MNRGGFALARHPLLALIRHAGGSNPADGDAELLARYAADGDHPAFAELVRRYARLVWGQCRGLLPSEPDADDAFQATFLALARSAAHIRDPNRLGPWLHAVAHRVCLNARRAAARRKKRERGTATAEGTTPVADSAWDAAAAAVQEEVGRLPESLRMPFVLCCLEGKAPTDAAKQLGMKWGTFSARLSRAKQWLLERLSARGIGAGVVLAAVGVGAMPTAAAVERAVSLGSAGASVPASVLSLASGVGVMGVSRTKLLAAVAIAAVGLIGLLLPGGGNPVVPAASAAPVPKETLEVKTKKLQELWGMLLDADEAVSSRALLEMSARPKADVVAFLAGKLKPLKLTEERAKQLLAELNDDKEETAKAAFEELGYFDPRLVLQVGDMLKDLPQGRHRERVASLLLGTGLDGLAGCKVEYNSAAAMAARNGGRTFPGNFMVEDPNPKRAGAAVGIEKYSTAVAETPAELSGWLKQRHWVRATRAVMILEHLGTPEAVKALEVVATGHEDASPTKAAKEAVERLKKR